jgi:hypothetical protein
VSAARGLRGAELSAGRGSLPDHGQDRGQARGRVRHGRGIDHGTRADREAEQREADREADREAGRQRRADWTPERELMQLKEAAKKLANSNKTKPVRKKPK